VIARFGENTALLIIDVQVGVDVLAYWGGPFGRRNNPAAEENIASLLRDWRREGRQVIFTCHDSREAASPLKLELDTGRFKPGLEPEPRELVIRKDVNSAFIGTPLEIELRRRGVQRLVCVGFFTNMCVESSVRMANNLGFDTYVVHDACATTNRIARDGTDLTPESVHEHSVANMHREFATAISTADAVRLLRSSASDLARQQGNE
jgi:nicotinamidase-related amidase